MLCSTALRRVQPTVSSLLNKRPPAFKIVLGAVTQLRVGLAGDASSQTLSDLVRSGRKAVCIGKNYHEHITEMSQLGPEWKLEENPEPVLFLKPTTSYAWPGGPLVLPCSRGNVSVKHGVHHELELAVIIGKRVKGERDHQAAMQAVAGYVLAIDATERDEQTSAKVKGMPWCVSKGYDSFLPLSEPFKLKEGEDWRSLRMWLRVNGEQRQACDAGTMINSVPSLICYISSIMTLEPGDLVVTGTPAGVSRLHAGDRITAGIDGYCEMQVDVMQEAQ